MNSVQSFLNDAGLGRSAASNLFMDLGVPKTTNSPSIILLCNCCILAHNHILTHKLQNKYLFFDPWLSLKIFWISNTVPGSSCNRVITVFLIKQHFLCEFLTKQLMVEVTKF